MVESRCNGLSGRFMSVKVGGKCTKHHSKDGKHKDMEGHVKRDVPDADEPHTMDAHSDLPGARRSLTGHHDKHDKKKHADKGKKGDKEANHDDKHADMDSKHRKGQKKHLGDADFTFGDLEGKLASCLHAPSMLGSIL